MQSGLWHVTCKAAPDPAVCPAKRLETRGLTCIPAPCMFFEATSDLRSCEKK